VSSNPATFVQVVPTELILKPGDKVNVRARLFDARRAISFVKKPQLNGHWIS
jgi:hypothetical protein